MWTDDATSFLAALQSLSLTVKLLLRVRLTRFKAPWVCAADFNYEQ